MEKIWKMHSFNQMLLKYWISLANRSSIRENPYTPGTRERHHVSHTGRRRNIASNSGRFFAQRRGNARAISRGKIT